MSCAQTVENSENRRERKAQAEGQRVVFNNNATDVEYDNSDNNRIKHTDNRNGNMNDVFQTKVGNDEAKERDEGHEAFIFYLVVAQFSEIAGDGSREADGGGQAGADDDEREHKLACKPHVMRSNHAQKRRTIGNDAENVGADSACISKSAVYEGEKARGNQACIGTKAREHLRVFDTLLFNGFNCNRAEKNCGQKVHGVIAFLKAAEERRNDEGRIRRGQRTGRIFNNADDKNRQADDEQWRKKLADMRNDFRRVNREKVG